MGKEQTDTCIPHCVDYRTMVILHTTYLSLTHTLEAFAIVIGVIGLTFSKTVGM